MSCATQEKVIPGDLVWDSFILKERQHGYTGIFAGSKPNIKIGEIKQDENGVHVVACEGSYTLADPSVLDTCEGIGLALERARMNSPYYQF
jgi:hypothetical protein